MQARAAARAADLAAVLGEAAAVAVEAVAAAAEAEDGAGADRTRVVLITVSTPVSAIGGARNLLITVRFR